MLLTEQRYVQAGCIGRQYTTRLQQRDFTIGGGGIYVFFFTFSSSFLKGDFVGILEGCISVIFLFMFVLKNDAREY